MKSFWKYLSFLSVLLVTTGAWAHPHVAGGSMSGLLQPHLGWTDFLAIFAVGMLVAGIIKRNS